MNYTNSNNTNTNTNTYTNFKYQDDKDIKVTLDTVKYTPNTFLKTGQLWEKESLHVYYKTIEEEIEKRNTDIYKNIVIIDVGAQSGLYTLYLKFLQEKYINKNIFMHSFEPFPLTYNLLKDNIELNEIKNIITYNMALSDTVGTSTLNICDSNNGLNTLGTNPLRFDNYQKLEVSVNTIDNIFSNMENIDIVGIKIDVEGWEYHVLQGSKNIIEKYKPIIQVEWNKINIKQCNVNEDDIKKIFVDMGYKEISHTSEEKIFAYK